MPKPKKPNPAKARPTAKAVMKGKVFKAPAKKKAPAKMKAPPAAKARAAAHPPARPVRKPTVTAATFSAGTAARLSVGDVARGLASAALAAAPYITSTVAAASAPSPAPMAKLGPLLREALGNASVSRPSSGLTRLALDIGGGDTMAEAVLPLSISIPPQPPQTGERWPQYKQRLADLLGRTAETLRREVGLKCEPVHAANLLQTCGIPGQIEAVLKMNGIHVVEFDPLLQIARMDDVVRDIELPLFLTHHAGLRGKDVRVAVLDSGIDTAHPYLRVADSVSTCGEAVDHPGLHATHVAGSIASRDSIYGGVAPEVTLLNIKVLDSQGRGQPSFITRGIDEALDRQAQVLSLSVGFNHLPTWSQGGHGWSCPDGQCQLCMAVNNAALLEGVTVVVAAGNEHQRAEFLRSIGNGTTFDTELSCPGQAAQALTVAALTKQTFLTAPFSSRGPASYGVSKPDIAAPGVNVTSCAPVRRDNQNQPIAGLSRADLTTTLSGTSMATPVVSGAVALIIERRREAGLSIGHAEVRAELMQQAFRHLAAPAVEVGAGRINLASL